MVGTRHVMLISIVYRTGYVSNPKGPKDPNMEYVGFLY